MKSWTTNMVSNQVNENSRRLMQKIDKQFKETREMFNVPGVIAATAQDGTSPEFLTFEEYVIAMTRRQGTQEENHQELDR